ncbi:hypothetical protein HDV05_002071, partial [Chytridiales sp. JEL 0842]
KTSNMYDKDGGNKALKDLVRNKHIYLNSHQPRKFNTWSFQVENKLLEDDDDGDKLVAIMKGNLTRPAPTSAASTSAAPTPPVEGGVPTTTGGDGATNTAEQTEWDKLDRKKRASAKTLGTSLPLMGRLAVNSTRASAKPSKNIRSGDIDDMEMAYREVQQKDQKSGITSKLEDYLKKKQDLLMPYEAERIARGKGKLSELEKIKWTNKGLDSTLFSSFMLSWMSPSENKTFQE